MKKNLLKLAALLTVAVMSVGVLASCGDNKAVDGENVLTMATNATFPPFEFYEGEQIVGIDADIAAAIADKLGMTLKIQDTEFGSIITGVQSGKYDIGMAGMTVTDERKLSVDFTDSYATGIQSVIVKEGSDIKTLDDIEGKKIGVQQDTTGHIYASAPVEEGGYGEDAVVPFNKGTDAVAALVAGKVDCVIIDNEPAKAYVAANEGLVILDTEYAVEDYAICISKDNAELLEKVNTALGELIEDGTVKSIVDRYVSAE